MRVNGAGSARAVVVGGAVLVIAIGVLLVLRDGASDPGAAGGASPTPATVAASQGGHPKIKHETKRFLGSFHVGKGRTIRLSTGETIDGMGCLIEEEGSGVASTCLEDGLFSERRAELMVSSMGGPERFDELRVVGVVAPSVAAAVLEKSDGTSIGLELNDRRAFAFESPATDLESGVVPSGLRLLGRNGRVVERVEFPVGS